MRSESSAARCAAPASPPHAASDAALFPERAVVVEKQPHVQPRVRDAERRVHSLRRGARDRLDRRFFKHVSSFHRRTALRPPPPRGDSLANCAAALLVLVYTKVHGKYRYLQKHCGAEVRRVAPPSGHASGGIKKSAVPRVVRRRRIFSKTARLLRRAVNYVRVTVRVPRGRL